MKTAALIFNPRAGSWQTARQVEAVLSTLESSGYRTEALPTEAPGHATELARSAAAAGTEVIFALGGDGTLRETAAGVLGTDAALAPLPAGTVNVVALALGIPLDPLRAARSLSRTEVLEMDVGLCAEEVFLMQTSAGFDAQVMARLHTGLKRRFGKAAVAVSGLGQWLTYDHPTIRLVADGRPLAATLIAVCNLPYYAGSWRMAPTASISDGILDLVLFRGEGRLQILSFARDLVLGRHTQRADVELMRVREVEIRGPQDLAIQLDGDALPLHLPATVRLAPSRIRMLRPRATIRSQRREVP